MAQKREAKLFTIGPGNLQYIDEEDDQEHMEDYSEHLLSPTTLANFDKARLDNVRLDNVKLDSCNNSVTSSPDAEDDSSTSLLGNGRSSSKKNFVTFSGKNYNTHGDTRVPMNPVKNRLSYEKVPTNNGFSKTGSDNQQSGRTPVRVLDFKPNPLQHSRGSYTNALPDQLAKRVENRTSFDLPEKKFLEVPTLESVLGKRDTNISEIEEPLADDKNQPVFRDVGGNKMDDTVDTIIPVVTSTATQSEELRTLLSPSSPGKNSDIEFQLPVQWNRRLRDIHGRKKFDRLAAKQKLKDLIPKMEMTREEMIKKYRIHIFVLFFFLLTVILVSLAWYYKNMALELLYARQAIFFNPRTRKISLTDPLSTSKIEGKLGQDIPLWQLPLHCPIVMKNPHSKECIWKEHAILRIDHTQATGIQCYTVSWESLTPQHAPYDCFEVADGEWYGPSNNSDSTYPIRGEFVYEPTHSSSRRDGVFGSAVNFYWLSSTGTGLYVISDNPVQVSWNRTGDNKLCIRANYSGSLYHQDSTTELAMLNYTLCKGVDAVVTHTHMQNMSLQGALKFPPDLAFSGAWWSVPDIVQSGTVNQSHIEGLMKSLAENSFVNNKLTLDVDWEETTGDLTFDAQRFPNISEVFDSAKNRSNEIVLSVSPYFKYTTQNFNEGVAGSYFIQDAGGEVAGLTRYQNSLAAVLDATNPQATTWFAKKLQALKGSGVDSFRLTYGSQGWLPYKPQFYWNDSTPGTFRKLMTELMGNNSELLTVDYTSDSRHVAGFVPVPAIVDPKTKCLTGAIDTALTLGLMGYPFILLDGIRAQSTEPEFSPSNKPSEELFIRWLQLATMFPAYQFNIPPWSFRPEVTTLASNLTTQRLLLLNVLNSEELRREVEAGLPIIRPIWWINPTPDVHAMKAKDQYLIGSSLLVAPILCEKQTTRDIFVPSGVWEDLKLHKVVIGPRLLKDYAVEPYEIPVFSYRKEHGV